MGNFAIKIEICCKESYNILYLFKLITTRECVFGLHGNGNDHVFKLIIHNKAKYSICKLPIEFKIDLQLVIFYAVLAFQLIFFFDNDEQSSSKLDFVIDYMNKIKTIKSKPATKHFIR